MQLRALDGGAIPLLAGARGIFAADMKIDDVVTAIACVLDA